MPARPAHFPNAVIGLLPSGLKKFKQRQSYVFACILRRRIESCLATLKKGVGYLSEDIQLKLP